MSYFDSVHCTLGFFVVRCTLGVFVVKKALGMLTFLECGKAFS